LLTDDCLARGLDLTAGGARYNFTGVQGVGVAIVADSLAAIDLLVFDEKRLTMEELLAALDTDFQGQEPLRQMLLNKAPKYGNDDDRVDRFGRLAAEVYCHAVEKHRSFRGGSYSPGLYSVTTHVAFGLMVGATPDGRHASEPLPRHQPCARRDRCGPTAGLKSAAKLDHAGVQRRGAGADAQPGRVGKGSRV
jgi:formate C-acetyltransferase